MDRITNPFYTLRQQIRHAGRQYRDRDDTSGSLFHPKNGFVYAYDIAEVEAALDAFEQSLPSEYRETEERLSPRELLLRQAELIKRTHPSLDARNLASGTLRLLQELEETKE